MFDIDEIKNGLQKILIYYGAIPPNNQGNWTCLSSRHKDPRNNLSIKNNICCCHCGLKGDSINIIAELEGLNYKDDFSLIIKKAAEILKLPEIDKKDYKHNNNYKKEEKIYVNDNKIILLNNTILGYFNDSKKNDYSYFYNRGITRKEIYLKNKLIIGNPLKIFTNDLKCLLPKVNNIWAFEYIIPIMKNECIVNCILRRNDKKSMNNNKIYNLKGLKPEFLNIDYLYNDNLKYLFVCEGWADALSFENSYFKSIAINSISMINKFVDIIKSNKNKFVDTIFLIAFDNDEKQWGQIAAKKLIKMLHDLNLNASNLKIKGYKDINEYYTNDKKVFEENANLIINSYK